MQAAANDARKHQSIAPPKEKHKTKGRNKASARHARRSATVAEAKRDERRAIVEARLQR